MVLKIKRSLLIVICLCAMAAVPIFGRWIYLCHESIQVLGQGGDYSHPILIRLMQNNIQDDVSEFYQAYYATPIYVDSWDTVIVDMQKVDDDYYTVTFGIKPYLGAHITTGYDEIQYAIRTFGTAERSDYAHLRSEELPDDMKSLQIKEVEIRSKE